MPDEIKYHFLFVYEGGAYATEALTVAEAEKKFGQRRRDRPATEHLFRISDIRDMWELQIRNRSDGKVGFDCYWVPVGQPTTPA